MIACQVGHEVKGLFLKSVKTSRLTDFEIPQQKILKNLNQISTLPFMYRNMAPKVGVIFHYIPGINVEKSSRTWKRFLDI